MGDKIEYNDLFSPDAFSKAVEGINSIKVAFEGLSNEFKTILVEQKQFQEGFKVRSYDDIVKLNKSLAETEKTLKEFTAAQNAVKQSDIELAKLAQEKQKAQQQSIKTEIEYQKLQKISNAESKKKITLYQQESKLLRDLKNEYKNVALAQGQTSKAAQDLLAKITPLDAKLKQLDKTTGDNFRNVGNYSEALKGFGSSVNNILGAAGISVGLSAGVQFLKDSFAEFANAEKATKDLKFALTNVGGEGAEALEKLTTQADALEESLGLFESEDIQVLQKELVNLGASSSQIEALTPKILDLAKATGKDLGEATDIAIKAINGQTKGLKSVGLEFEDTGNKTENYNILLEKLDKFQGAAAASAETLEGKQQRLSIVWGNAKEAVGEFITNGLVAMIDQYDVLIGKQSEVELGLKMISRKQIDEFKNDFKKYGAKGEIETAIRGAQVRVEELLAQSKRPDADLEKVNEQLSRELATINNYRLAYKEFLNELNKPKPKGLGEETPEEKAARLKKEEEDRKKSAEKKADDEAKLRKQIEDRNAASFTNEKQRQEAIIKLDFERRKKEIEQSKATKKTKDEALLTLELEYYNKLADIENKYIDEKEKKEKEARDKQKKEDDEAFDAAVKEAQRLTDIEDKEREEKKKKEKEAREQELKELFDVASKALSIAEKEIKDKEKLRQDALDREIEQRDSNIEEQKRRAEQGLSNTLAFEEKALKDAEAKKEEENKKALKREKALTFFKLLSANAEKDPNSALQKTITEMLLGEAIAGAFFKGTEKVEDDLKGNKVHNGRDGYVVAVDGSERVLTGKQNELIGNMSNEDLARLANDYQNGLLPKYAITDSMSSMNTAEKLVSSAQLHQLVSLNKNIEDLKQTIINKKEVSLAIDNLGNVLRTEIENGVKRVEITKSNKPRI